MISAQQVVSTVSAMPAHMLGDGPVGVPREITVSTGGFYPSAFNLWERPEVKKLVTTSRSFEAKIPDPLVSDSEPSTTALSPRVATTQLWWESVIYELVESGEETTALRTLFRAIEGLFANRNLETLERGLDRIDLRRLSPDLMVGLIRATYRARRALPNWAPMLDRVKEELETRKVPDWQRLLVGL